MNAPSHEVFLALGSNLAPEESIVHALELLQQHVTLVSLSTCYQTEPIGPNEMGSQGADTPWFINTVLRSYTEMDARVLKFDVLRPIEHALGRRRSADTFAPRTIDIDILLHGDLVVHEQNLQLPDPHILQRPYLLAGLLELAPELIMPDTAGMLKDYVPALLTDTAHKAHAMMPMQAFTQMLRERFFFHEH